jgi:hypothetical protein
MIDGLTRLERVPTRYLHSSYPKDVDQYKQYVYKAFQSHNIVIQSLQLFGQAGIHNQNNAIYISLLNNIDRLITDIQLTAEQK